MPESIAEYKTPLINYDPVRIAVGQWLARHLANPDLARWVVDKGAQLHPHFADLLERELEKTADIPEALKRVWRALITQIGLVFREPPVYRLVAKRQRLRTEVWSPALRLEFISEFSPSVIVSPQRFPYPAIEESAQITIAQILSVDCGIRSGDDREEIAAALRARNDYRVVAVDLAVDFTTLLRAALDLQASFDQASRDHDRGYIDHPSIVPHEQNKHHYGWTILIDLLRESFDVARQDRPDVARDLDTF